MPAYDQVPVHQYICASDKLANEDNIKTLSSWKERFLAATSLRQLEAFVGEAMHGTATYVKDKRGSYNIMLVFRVLLQHAAVAITTTTQQYVVLRLPLRGFYPPELVAEMLTAEVAATADNGTGSPYLLTEYVEGEILDNCLNDWYRSKDPRDEARLNAAFEDIAAMQLAMYRHRFDRIGAVRAPDAEDGDWNVTQRPLTHAMRDLLLALPGTKAADAWPAGPLATAADYKALFLQLHGAYHDDLRSINIPSQWKLGPDHDVGQIDLEWVPKQGDAIDFDLARAKAAGPRRARRGLAHPDCLPHFSAGADNNTGPFCIFNRDFHPRNMLVNEETGRIVALFDLEGTNAMPVAFAEDPPLFLRPFMLFHVIVLDKLSGFLKQYEPLLETFLGIMERLEAQQTPRHTTSNDPEPYLHDKIKLALDAQQEDMEPVIAAYQRHTEQQIADYEKDRMSRQNV
ncbi:hypothetical protein SCUCBS95973_001713 [Sporothrix curviconia]|uniref:Aminoglycoside phosphotransferase domain-containing protein n=1 Tax=Sporothrix curviconia TaxID=1260050 RepID=A0ABP0B0W3_9PEZI